WKDWCIVNDIKALFDSTIEMFDLSNNRNNMDLFLGSLMRIL
ncbi:hypothetical protein A2U01_0116762, partial [Trifolium medium]|nr:hypothetical protein [Trifolium medium]